MYFATLKRIPMKTNPPTNDTAMIQPFDPERKLSNIRLVRGYNAYSELFYSLTDKLNSHLFASRNQFL